MPEKVQALGASGPRATRDSRVLKPSTISEPLTLGVELELQLVNTHDYDLAPYAGHVAPHETHPLPGGVCPR